MEAKNLIEELGKKIALKLADLQATFINTALARHVPQYLIDLYVSDGQQVPGAFLSFEYLKSDHPQGQAFKATVEYKGKTIGYAIFDSWLDKGRMIIEISKIDYGEKRTEPES